MIQILIFLSVFSAVLLGSSFFIAGFFLHAITGTFQGVWTSGLLLWVPSLTFLIGEWRSRVSQVIWIKHLGAILLGGMSVSFAVATAGYVALILGVPGPVSAIIGVILIGTFVGVGMINARRTPKITLLESIIVRNNDLGLKIVHLTDLHLDGITSTKWVQKLVDTVNSLNPDIVVFTGDLLDISPNRIPEQIEILKQITASTAKLAVSGNHDFYMEYPTYQSVLETIGFTLIDNQHIHVSGIDFVGISDRDGRRFGHIRPEISELFSTVRPGQTVIVLSHRPDEFSEFAKRGATLQLSGHTHWGQLPPFDLIIRFWYTHGRGHGKIGDSQIYVSKGTGVWGPPMRLFGRSEIVVVTI
jgi:predicted MPP superfamily phosphohydrolase